MTGSCQTPIPTWKKRGRFDAEEASSSLVDLAPVQSHWLDIWPQCC